MNSAIANTPDISFIDNATVDEVIDQLVKDYQDKYKEVTGKTVALAQADPYRMILYACGLMQYQTMQYVDRSGKQNLLKYAFGEFLDNLAPLRGITRLQAQPAVTTLRFNIASALASAVSIPAGTRVSNGNEVYFYTNEYTEIAAGNTYVEVDATCTEEGIAGNGFRAGEINVLVETLPYITSVENTTETSGGSDVETDESLADRIYIASSAYSVAGPEDAYKYWTKTASADITDVSVDSPEPCVVDVRFILKGGELPDEALIQKVLDTLTDKNIKPLTDRVLVSAPETVSYDINVTYYIDAANKTSAVSIQNAVNSAIEEYKVWQSSAIGQDINPSELIYKIKAAGAKRVEVTAPVYVEVGKAEIPKVGTVAVTYGGIE